MEPQQAASLRRNKSNAASHPRKIAAGSYLSESGRKPRKAARRRREAEVRDCVYAVEEKLNGRPDFEWGFD